jgi:hypothetical protein
MHKKYKIKIKKWEKSLFFYGIGINLFFIFIKSWNTYCIIFYLLNNKSMNVPKRKSIVNWNGT